MSATTRRGAFAGGQAGRRLVAAALLAFGPSWLAGCAGSFAAVEGSEGRVYEHRELHYRVEYPRSADGVARWAPTGFKEADLLFTGPDGAVMSLAHECRPTLAAPEFLAQNLMIGLEERALRHSAPLQYRGLPGWSLVFDTHEEGVRVRVKTVTLKGEHCVYDWVLVAPGAFRAPEKVFDRWWRTFVPPPPAEPVQVTAEVAP